MDLAALAFSSGWASGINAYLTVLVLGLFTRFSDWDVAPEVLGRTDVLIVAGLMASVEFVVDKVPWIDSVWDGISTVVRPAVAALVASQLGGDSADAEAWLLALIGGSTALASHGVKAGVRLAVNTSPEPFTNVAVSTTEDVGVITVASLAVLAPAVAFAIAVVGLLCGLAVVVLFWAVIRRTAARRRARRLDRTTG